MRSKVLILLILCSCTLTGMVTVPVEQGAIRTYFCETTDCFKIFQGEVENATRLVCAQYNPGKSFTQVIESHNGQMVTDKSLGQDLPGLMHNKFCVIDDKVWTGSWNPVQAMSIPNNVVVLESPTLAAAYAAKFSILDQGIVRGGPKSDSSVILNGSKVSAYFCPEDHCQQHVLDSLERAQSSIHFMTYSFTDPEIANLLLEKGREGVEVKGIFDPRMDKYTEFSDLKDFSSIHEVHHKVFIIDGEIVVTGSYNPTRSGDVNNDENVIIIDNKDIAAQFEEEFESINRLPPSKKKGPSAE